MLNIAVCDDNPIDLSAESASIEKVLCEQGVQFNIYKFNDAESLLKQQSEFNMVFIDIEMKTMSGIEAAEILHKRGCLIFFVTNYEVYIDELLNKHAFRFWVKPIDEKRLASGIHAAIQEIEKNKSFITVTTAEKCEKHIPVKDIIFIYVERKKVYIVTANSSLQIKENFKHIRKILPESCFCEPYAGIYVNFNYVISYSSTNVICKCEDREYKLYMSRRKYPDFKTKFIDWAGEH